MPGSTRSRSHVAELRRLLDWVPRCASRDRSPSKEQGLRTPADSAAGRGRTAVVDVSSNLTAHGRSGPSSEARTTKATLS